MRIIFLEPGKKVGGSNVLLARLARSISEREGVSSVVVDYVDGYMATHVQGTSVDFRPYLPGEPVTIMSGETLVTPLSSLWMMKDRIHLKRGAHVLFWNIHPNNALVNSPLHHLLARIYPENAARLLQLMEPGLRSRICRLLESIHEAGGLIQMDVEVHHSIAVLFGIDFIPKLIPIPVPVPNKACCQDEPRYFKTYKTDDSLKLGWLGRLSADKVPSLLATLENVESYSKQTGIQIDFHIIGEGTRARRIHKWAANQRRVTCYFAGTKLGEQLDDYLCSNMQALFAMGTACLEGARLGLPSVLVDAAIWRIPPQFSRYCWLYETEGFCLGRIWSPNRTSYPHSIDDILDSISSQSRQDTIGNRCREYVSSNHNIVTITDALIKAVEECQCGESTIDFKSILDLHGLDRAIGAMKTAWVRFRR